MDKKRILLVEDNKLFLDSICFVLNKNYNVDVAMSLNSALNLLNSNKYDLLITDGAYPEKDGYCLDTRPISDEDYRGSIVAAFAKNKDIKVIGMSMEPKRLKNCDVVFSKTQLNIMDLLDMIKKFLK